MTSFRILLSCLVLAFPLSALAQSSVEDEAASAAEPTTQIEENPTVILHTNFGIIELELFADKAPKSVENFIAYVESGHYDNTLFHRVIPNFMIQGGGFDLDFQQKPTNEPVVNEADNGLSNTRGTLAMARTMSPHSATAQFFINVQDNTFLDHQGTYSGQAWGYAVFGQVSEGMDVVDAIRQVPTGRKAGHQDVPVDPVIIERVEIKTES
ncbi:MAG TPA: peptidylprolyl isomerase [Wenzhouxiangella sp.]